MTASFASQAWIDQLREGLDGSATVRTESVSWIFGPLLLVVEADEEHGVALTGISIDVHEGSIRSISLTDASEAARVPWAIRGSFARWKGLFSEAGGSIVDLVLEAKLQLRGDLPTLARHRALLDAITSAGSAVPTDWQDEQEKAEPQPA